MAHVHEYRSGRSESVETCSCGAFRFTEEWLKTHPAITETPGWTVQRVKDELPDVDVLHAGKVRRGFVRGRLLPFAAVSLADRCGCCFTAEFAWATIADCLNRGVPLRA